MSYSAAIVPENAPFDAAQRAWLNGFLAGFLNPRDQRGSPNFAPQTAEAAIGEAESFPWHDPTLELEARLALAAGRPLERRLMAAMAQLDCGQCGYLCQSYAEAIAYGSESSLARCVPGGRATTRALKELVAAPAAAAPLPVPAASPAPEAGGPVPFMARLESSTRLNRDGSEKDIRHVVLQAADSGVAYEVGDSFGVHAANPPDEVNAIIARLGASADDAVDCPDGTRHSLRDALALACDVGRPSDEAIEVLASRAPDHNDSERLQALAEGYPGAGPEGADLLELLDTFPSARPPVQELVLALGALQPRLYSIASSPKTMAGEVHLTVAAVRYRRRGRLRQGLASIYLTERLAPGAEIPAFVRPSHGFRLPRESTAPIIMIGPGTGVAPFRAFLQERRAIGARGRNWLFFGDQRRDFDFLYRDELEGYLSDGLLSRLDTAFSRDQDERIYVQHRMREQAATLWSWLQDGAYLYVCGDAQRMAKDVDAALAAIIAKKAGMSLADAKAYLAALTRDQRYQRDVY